MKESFENINQPENYWPEDSKLRTGDPKLDREFNEGIIGQYPVDVVENPEDQKKITQAMERHGPKGANAILAEFITLEGIEAHHWLGECVTAKRASRYDDYFNGTDLILEFSDPTDRQAEPTYLALDVTSALRGEQTRAITEGVEYSRDVVGKKQRRKSDQELKYHPAGRVPRLTADLPTRGDFLKRLGREMIGRESKETLANQVTGLLLAERLFEEMYRSLGSILNQARITEALPELSPEALREFLSWLLEESSPEWKKLADHDRRNHTHLLDVLESYQKVVSYLEPVLEQKFAEYENLKQKTGKDPYGILTQSHLAEPVMSG